MLSEMKSFWLCFVPLFVAVDVIGLLPVFISLTVGMNKKQIRKVILQSTITALVVALIFVAVGTGIFRLLNISVADFMVAGGLLLFVISIRDILASDKSMVEVDPDSVGAVPIGVPLITGPAVLTTSLLLVNEHGAFLTSLGIASNILIVGVMFMAAPLINKVLGKTGAKAVSKIISLLLAAIGVMVIRKGIAIYITQGLHM